MTLPNFIIVGAPRSGTTSLYYYFKQHPEVFMSEIKEMFYFSSDMKKRAFNTDKDYESLFSGRTTEKAIGEVSSVYLYDQEVPKRIFEKLGKVKIIISLRNPILMSYSVWAYNYYKLGIEKYSFEEALSHEKDRMSGGELCDDHPLQRGCYSYFNLGLYYKQVKRYIDTFGKNNTHIHLFEDFKKDPAGICKSIYLFLNVDPDFSPDLEKHNVSSQVRFHFLSNFLLFPPDILKRIYYAIPYKARIKVYRVGKFIFDVNHKPHNLPPIDEQLRVRLIDSYKEDIKKLEGLIERDLSIWYAK